MKCLTGQNPLAVERSDAAGTVRTESCKHGVKQSVWYSLIGQLDTDNTNFTGTLLSELLCLVFVAFSL